MNPDEERVRAVLSKQASEWFVANDHTPLEGADSAALVAWLKTSPVHVEEFLGVAVVARELRAAATDPEYGVESLVARARAEEDRTVTSFWSASLAAAKGTSSRRWLAAALSAAVMIATVLGLALLSTKRAVRNAPLATIAPESFETRHGEQRTYRLSDQSLMQLNTDSAVSVRYSRAQRLVVIKSGEAEFEVAHDPGRPFRVVAGAAEVLDLGTKFDVRLKGGSTLVTVVDGRVSVRLSAATDSGSALPGQGPPRQVELHANEQIIVSSETWPVAVMAVDAARSIAWLHRQIAFDHEPLAVVAAEFNRYAPKPIEILTPQLRNLEVSGIFSTDDTEEFLAFLRSLQGVRVEVTDTRIRVSQKTMPSATHH